MAFCNPCVRPANSSIIICTQHPTNSIKKLFRHKLFKKSSTLTPSRSPIQNYSHKSSARFQRIKGSNFVREINPISECNSKTNSTNNYDMTIYYYDQLDDTQITLSRRESKKIPHWARKSQLQLALINQIYFNDKNPEDIFGSVHMDLAHEMIQSIKLHNTKLSSVYSSSMLPPNFV